MLNNSRTARQLFSHIINIISNHSQTFKDTFQKLVRQNYTSVQNELH